MTYCLAGRIKFKKKTEFLFALRNLKSLYESEKFGIVFRYESEKLESLYESEILNGFALRRRKSFELLLRYEGENFFKALLRYKSKNFESLKCALNKEQKFFA